jgi:hypothetical protein
MAQHELIDETHLSLYVPRALTDREARAVRRTLNGAGFRARIYRAVRSVVRRFRSLDQVRLTLSR